MTQHKHLKDRVRARMARTGERYAAARRHVVAAAAPAVAADPAAPTHAAPGATATASAVAADPTAAPFLHLPGSVPAATALRTLLAARGVVAAHTGAPPSEALVYGIAGGVGIGMFQFHYAKENVGTFFLGARHRWDDDLAYLTAGAARFGLAVAVDESGGAMAAAAQLRARLADGPVIAWVDLACLPHRALPTAHEGSGYHVVVVQAAAGDSADALWLSDAGDAPVRIAAADLARARARIAKQRHRLLALGERSGQGVATADGLAAAVLSGLAACADGLVTPPRPGYRAGFTLDGLRVWAERLRGGGGRDGWPIVFPPGPRLWDALIGVHDWIESYGTGGGLGRPLQAAFLREAAAIVADNRLADAAAHYDALGAAWSDLAEAALPAGVPLFDAARTWSDARAARQSAPDDAAAAAEAEARAAWNALEAARAAAAVAPALSDADGRALCAALADRVDALHAAEVAGQARLAAVAGEVRPGAG